MTTISASYLEKNTSKVLDQVFSKSVSIVITKNKKKSILLPLDEFAALQETAHLLKNEKNRKRLEKSLYELKNGDVVRVQK